MVETHVLRFPISGQEDGSFLLEVSSNGSRPLDLKLMGSESTAVFFAKLRHKKVDEYKASPGHCTDEEWQQILISTFVDLKSVSDIEVRAEVQSDGNAVTLSFRKNIQGITQRLGSIKLDENEQTEISPFDWCVSAITSRTKVMEELAAATAKIEALKQTVNELKAQLDDFITTKQEDETEMLEKFRDLLNEKKVKIRQQQRLLAAAKVDPEKLANLGGGEHQDAGPSRARKRKAPVEVKEEDEESEDGFERMDVDDENPEFDSDVDEDQQLSTDNDATASDGDNDNEPPTIAEVRQKEKAVSPPGRNAKSAAASGSNPNRNTRAAKQKQQAPSATSNSEDEADAPPPPRSLPFMRGKKAPPPPKPVEDDETQSDEDSEL